MKKPSWPLYLVSAILPIATACGQVDATAANAVVQKFALAEGPGESFVQPLSAGGDSELWLIASLQSGVSVMDGSGKRRSHLDTRAELLDLREKVETSTGEVAIAATVTEPGHTPTLLSINASGQLRELARLPAPSFEVKNLCLQRDSSDKLYLYLLDERGSAEHWLVLDEQGEPNPRHIRNLAVAPNSTSCLVDDDSGTLYVTEEDVGIWAYDAWAEAAPGRSPVALATPFGDLPGGTAALGTAPGGLLAISTDDFKLHSYAVEGDEATPVGEFDLSPLGEPERISRPIPSGSGTLEILVYDDGDRSHHRVSIPWTTSGDASGSAARTPLPEVYAVVQTDPVARFGDAADDPAIWVHPTQPHKSRVLGTDKKGGLLVFDMQGKKQQFLPSGNVNNVDLRRGFRLGDRTVDLAIASNRDDNSLALYTIDRESGRVNEAGSIPTSMEDIYGFCMYKSAAGEFYAIPNDKSGEFQQYLISDHNGKIHGELARSFHVESQPEGCVADDISGRLYVGEEGVAVWTIGADPDSGTTLEPVARIGGLIEDDIEGLALYHGNKRNYLVVSSQGNHSYVVLDAHAPYKLLGAFRVGLDAAAGIDGTSETDGIEVTSENLGGQFSEGMLVIQDGANVMPEAPQNFKYVPWRSVRQALNLD